MSGDVATELLALCDRLDQARAAATPGPWENAHPMTRLITGGAVTDRDIVRSDMVGQCDRDTNAALIVAAVNAVPELTAAVRRLLADRQAVRELAEAWATTPTDDPGKAAYIAMSQIYRAIEGRP